MKGIALAKAIQASKYAECSAHDLHSVTQMFESAVELVRQSRKSVFQRIVKLVMKQQKTNKNQQFNSSTSNDIDAQWNLEDKHTNLPLDCFNRASLKSLFNIESVLGSGTEGTVYLCTPVKSR